MLELMSEVDRLPRLKQNKLDRLERDMKYFIEEATKSQSGKTGFLS